MKDTYQLSAPRLKEIKNRLISILENYFKFNNRHCDLINNFIIIPDEYGCEDLKTDLPRASMAANKHNIHLSTDEFAFEICGLKFNKMLTPTYKYLVDCKYEDLTLEAEVKLLKGFYRVTKICVI